MISHIPKNSANSDQESHASPWNLTGGLGRISTNLHQRWKVPSGHGEKGRMVIFLLGSKNPSIINGSGWKKHTILWS